MTQNKSIMSLVISRVWKFYSMDPFNEVHTSIHILSRYKVFNTIHVSLYGTNAWWRIYNSSQYTIQAFRTRTLVEDSGVERTVYLVIRPFHR